MAASIQVGEGVRVASAATAATAATAPPERRVLVLGGSGALGQALLYELAHAGAAVSFTFYSQQALAESLAQSLGLSAYQVDLLQPDAVARLFDALAAANQLPQVVVHCAGVAPVAALDDINLADWDALHALHGRSALLCAQQMARRGLRGSLIFVAAIDGMQAVPSSAHYAASQAAMWGLTLALAKELGPKGILVNLAQIGMLEGGIAAHLAPHLRAAYQRYAALGRSGTCVEAARGLRWLALENTYLNGVQFPLTGGLG